MVLLEKRIKSRLDEKLQRLNKLRPLKPAQVEKLREQLEIEMTYNSNAIEGNTLTLRETYLVLREGVTIKGKPLADHLEAKDHKEAIDFLFQVVNDKKYPLTEHLIRQFQQVVTKDTEGDDAGKYRTGEVSIAGATHKPPEAVDVPMQMRSLMASLKREAKKLHPVEVAALLHHKLVYIHPFADGNGRTARLVMNLLLMRAGYPLAIILKNDRRRYYRVLQQADRGNEEPQVLFIAQAVERSLDLYLRTFDSDDQGRLLTLSEAAKGTPYSPKYLNLLARTGRLAAHKRGRLWYTTKQAIEQYKQQRLRVRG